MDHDNIIIEMTGSPKEAGFSTKEVFLNLLFPLGFRHGKMTKKNNEVNILVTDDENKMSIKMTLASELGVEIRTYQSFKDAYDLEGDI